MQEKKQWLLISIQVFIILRWESIYFDFFRWIFNMLCHFVTSIFVYIDLMFTLSINMIFIYTFSVLWIKSQDCLICFWLIFPRNGVRTFEMLLHSFWCALLISNGMIEYVVCAFFLCKRYTVCVCLCSGVVFYWSSLRNDFSFLISP